LRHGRWAFSVAVSESETTLFLKLLGELDRASAGRVEEALGRLAQPSAPRRVVLDLRDLTFLDMAGLRTILRANERGRAEGFEVSVVRPRGSASRVFTLTRVGQELSMIEESEAA